MFPAMIFMVNEAKANVHLSRLYEQYRTFVIDLVCTFAKSRPSPVSHVCFINRLYNKKKMRAVKVFNVLSNRCRQSISDVVT